MATSPIFSGGCAVVLQLGYGACSTTLQFPSVMPQLPCGTVAALLPRELVPGQSGCGGEQGWLQLRGPRHPCGWCCSCQCPSGLCRGPWAIPCCAVWNTWSTGEENLSFISLRRRSPQRERWSSYLYVIAWCVAFLLTATLLWQQNHVPCASLFSVSLVWISLCYATWSYSLVACFVS